MDWDKLRIFHAVAEAGSFTHAGETLNLSQSAISRQISTFEENLGISLFHRHARGLLLTEQGEILYKTTRDIAKKLSLVEARLVDSQSQPDGPLKITTAEFIGSTWLAPKMKYMHEAHPDIQVSILVDDRVLDLEMREADAAIRLLPPQQNNLIQRHLTTIHFHICGAKSYFEEYGYPATANHLREHTLIGYPEHAVEPFTEPNWIFRLADVNPQEHYNLLMVNSMYAIHRAVESGAGIAALPDYLIRESANLEVILPGIERPGVDMYFVYPEERRYSKRITLFRDFLLEILKKTKF